MVAEFYDLAQLRRTHDDTFIISGAIETFATMVVLFAAAKYRCDRN